WRRAALERLARAQAEDDRQDERDVEPDHGDRRANDLPRVAPEERRELEQERENADRPDGEDRRPVLPRDPSPDLVARHGAVTREREHHPRRRGDRRDRAE